MKVSSISGIAVIDSGSGVCFVSRSFVEKCNLCQIEYDGPVICAVSGDCFKPAFAAVLNIEIATVVVQQKCAVIEVFPFDVLLGVNWMRKTNFS